MFSYTYHHRVRYRECDPMGVVYHSHYVDFFEAARTEALREAGWPYKALEADGLQMPVIDLALKYRNPATYDDLLAITCLVTEPPRTRIRIEYEVRRDGEPDLLVTGHVSLCFIDTHRNRHVMAPAGLRALFNTSSA